MNKRIMALGSVTAGIITSIAMTGTVFAWHPKGVIVKQVQNETAKTALQDANTATTAVAAKPGDILKYVIEVRNDGAAATNNWNDMAKTVMTDSLPEGVALVDAPAQRTISVTMGTLKPGVKVVKEYRVKVTAATNTSITNKACFTGDSAANDNPQQGCDVAVIKVTVPPVTPPKPEEPKTPVTPPTPPVVKTVKAVETPMPQQLPVTGAGNVAAIFGSVTVAGYAARLVLLNRKRAIR